ncbi:MAG: polysaccharide deacetylase family protein, partial [Pseudomonadota bacterium]|nr:polysaccharide deacetylase family protein [Pseudomonadota bacterium]
ARNRPRSPRPLCGLRTSALWSRLDEALSRAADRSNPIPFWWRDDDAIAHTPAFDRLLALARGLNIPIAIAAIPGRAETSLAARLADEPLARILVHGLVHANHAGEARKKAEFGPDRPLSQLAEEAVEGLRLAKARFSDTFLPVFVPPWNRIAPGLVPTLPKLGFKGLSTFGRLPAREPAPGLLQANTHIDPIDWHNGRGLREPDAFIAELAETIAADADPEPIGLLTHHLVQDEATWRFCEELLERLAMRRIVQYQDPRAMFVGAQTPPT